MDPNYSSKGDAVDLSQKTDALKGKKLKIKRLVKRDDGHYSVKSVTVQSEIGNEQNDRLLSPKSSKHKHNLYELTNYSSIASKDYSYPNNTVVQHEEIKQNHTSNLITPGGFLEKLQKHSSYQKEKYSNFDKQEIDLNSSLNKQHTISNGYNTSTPTKDTKASPSFDYHRKSTLSETR